MIIIWVDELHKCINKERGVFIVAQTKKSGLEFNPDRFLYCLNKVNHYC